MEEISFNRFDACVRIGVTFDQLDLLTMEEAVEVQLKLSKLAKSKEHTLGSEIFGLGRHLRFDGIDYMSNTADLEIPGLNDIDRNLGTSQSLGFVVDLNEAILHGFVVADEKISHEKQLRPRQFVLSPSISIGFDCGEYISNDRTKGGFHWANDESMDKRRPQSTWKYWLKVRSNIPVSASDKAEIGIGFPAMTDLIAAIIDEKLIETHMEKLLNAVGVHARNTKTEKERIIISSATCGNDALYRNIYSRIQDAGSIEAIRDDEISINQFIDITSELNIISSRINGENHDPVEIEDANFIWCDLEEGASGLFAERVFDRTLILTGLCFNRTGDIFSLLNQDDQVNRHSHSSLVTRALMNQMVRWY